MKHSMQDEEALFEAARQLKSGGQRGAFLAQACADDTELQRRLEDLLAADEVADKFLKSASRSGGSLFSPSRPKITTAEEQADEQIGKRIGPYKILQRIGEGGGGVVYMADQDKPIERRVALKVIKLGMDTKSVIARFDAERHALAMMDHPNIARVLDAGVTETGRPYFVMELVRGVRITEYCDQNKLTRTSGWSCSSRFVRPFSTRIKRESFIATSNRRTSSSPCMTGCRCRRSLTSASPRPSRGGSRSKPCSPLTRKSSARPRI
jgi:serine/threonine protein kinase